MVLRELSPDLQILQFSSTFYQGWSVSDECNREGVKLAFGGEVINDTSFVNWLLLEHWGRGSSFAIL